MSDGRRRSFAGFRRHRSRGAVRNDLWIISASAELDGETSFIASSYHKPYWIDAVRAIPASCGVDAELAAALARSPNAAGVLVVGATRTETAEVVEHIGFDSSIRKMRTLSFDDDTEQDAMVRLDELAAESARARERMPISDLRIGIVPADRSPAALDAAGPLAGHLADELAARWCTVIAPLTPEALIASAAIEPRIDDRRERSRVRKAAALCMDERCGPISAAEQELASAQLAHIGGCRISRVLTRGEASTGEGGAQLVLAGGDTSALCTALAAAGASLIVCTTHDATPFGSIVPTMRITTDELAARRSPHSIDLDASALMHGASFDGMTAALLDMVLEIASGKQTSHEARGIWSISGAFTFA